VRAPFTPQAHLDESELADLVAVAIRMMDNTIDASGFPLEAQRQEAIAKRRIGLGMTGLADALMMTGLRYGSVEAAERAGDWARQISRAAYLASAHLAQEKGAFPLFDRDETLVAKTIGQASAGASATRLGPLCPKCNQPGLVHEAGCLSCVHCGWSKCN
jgi:ribonucleoside-diphosphate reductase alpha chain